MKNISELSDISAESGIIGTLIENPDYLMYSEHLNPRHFFEQLNGYLYWAIMELWKCNITNIDAYNLWNVLSKNKAAQRVIGEEIKVEALNDFLRLAKGISRKSIEEYRRLVSTVANYAFKRNLVNTLESGVNMCFEDSDGVKLFKSVQDKIDTLTTEHVEVEIQPFSQIVRGLWDDSRQALQKTGVIGYSPIIKELEPFITYVPGELVLYAAKRKTGKSMLAMNESMNLLMQGAGVLYIDTEMSDDLFMFRALAHLTKLSYRKIVHGNYSPEEEKKIENAVAWLEQQNFYHVRQSSYSRESLYFLSKKLKRDRGINFIVYDHLKTTNSRDSSEAYHELGQRINFLKDVICGELGYAGICLAQLNRRGEIAESYRLEQEPSAFVYMTKKEPGEIAQDGTKCGNMKLQVAGNRLGPQMDSDEYIDAGFEGDTCTYYNVDQHKEERVF